jgi:hypothetical protein
MVSDEPTMIQNVEMTETGNIQAEVMEDTQTQEEEAVETVAGTQALEVAVMVGENHQVASHQHTEEPLTTSHSP